jgi:hypothetical protein
MPRAIQSHPKYQVNDCVNVSKTPGRVVIPSCPGYISLVTPPLFCRLRLEIVFLTIAYVGIALEILLGIITLWVFQK